MNRTLHSNAHVKNAVLGIQVESNQTGEVIDRFNYRDLILHGLVANVTGEPTSRKVTLKLQHSDTDVPDDFVDVNIEGIKSVLTIKEGEGELHVNLDGFKQYIRVVANVKFTGGTTPKADIVCTAVLGNMVANPVR